MTDELDPPKPDEAAPLEADAPVADAPPAAADAPAPVASAADAPGVADAAPRLAPGAVTAPVKRAPPDAWDRAGDWLARHGALPALAVITIAILIVHARIFLGETVGDDLSFHFAESARLADCLRDGDFDFWNQSANAGYASAYYYQVIPQLASAIPAALFGHHLFWFQLSVVLPIILAPACAYRGMRLLGATPWQAVVAAFAVAFMNGESRWGSGNAGTFQVGLYTQTWALCAFPLALGHGARWVSHGKNLAPAIAWGAFVFLCHPFAGATLGIAILAGWFALAIALGIDKLRRRTREGVSARALRDELIRGTILAVLLALTWLPVLLPLLIDRDGFGGFPHRVNDEVGPGFKGLGIWYYKGAILDWIPPGMGMRIAFLTWLLPPIAIFARGAFFRWLWAPALVFAVLLGLGPNVGKIGDDLFPPVRALGTMQTVLAMGIGAGAIIVGRRLWELASRWRQHEYTIRTGLAAVGAALIVLIAIPGARSLGARVRVLGDVESSHRAELMEVNAILAKQPPGRKQVGVGAENHWWNLLSYAYDRVPALFQMGGGGLQASPNYDFLWTNRDFVKNAWIYDAPYLVFDRARGQNMPLGEMIARTEHYEVRRLPTPGLVSPVQITGTLPPGYKNGEKGHLAALEWIRGKDGLSDKVLAYEGSGGAGDPPDGKTLRAWHQDSPGDDADIVAEVEAAKPSTFVIRESWHPRWRAYVDRDEVAIRRVTPDFPAVDVPAGSHTIELRFERPWWAQAVWLLWPGVALAAWLVMRRRDRRGQPEIPAARVVETAAR